MNWEAIGAIGEIVGAAAVVLTLGYLAIQVRIGSKSTESQVHAALSAEMERLTTAIAQDDSLIEAMILAENDQELDEKQRYKLGYWFGGFLRVCESHFLQQMLGATKIDLQAPIAKILRGYARRDFFRTRLENNIATSEFTKWTEEKVLTDEENT